VAEVRRISSPRLVSASAADKEQPRDMFDQGSREPVLVEATARYSDG